jgi:glycine/D-amino acid oxidase-like deaminating enzyme
MNQLALRQWRELEQEAGEDLLVTTGGLDAGPLAKACADALSACGARHEWLSPRACAERFPGIATTDVESFLFQPDAGVSLAGRSVAAQVRLAAAAGVDVREEIQVMAIRGDGKRAVIETSEGELEADVAVVTPGAWMRNLAPEIPVDAHVQTVSYFRPAETGAVFPTYIEWGDAGFGWYEVPAAGDAPGVKVAEHRPGPRVDPATGPFEPDPAAVAATERYVGSRFPGLADQAIASETCLYEMTPDEHFIFDRRGPIVYGTGGSGHGFKFTPLFGELLAALAQGREPEVPLARFSLARFGGG